MKHLNRVHVETVQCLLAVYLPISTDTVDCIETAFFNTYIWTDKGKITNFPDTYGWMYITFLGKNYHPSTDPAIQGICKPSAL